MNLSELLQNGALIIDLRSKEAFELENISGSLNIPFDTLNSKLLKSNFVRFRRKETVILCSDNPSENAIAKELLESQGMLAVHDGGSFKNVQDIVGKGNK